MLEELNELKNSKLNILKITNVYEDLRTNTYKISVKEKNDFFTIKIGINKTLEEKEIEIHFPEFLSFPNKKLKEEERVEWSVILIEINKIIKSKTKYRMEILFEKIKLKYKYTQKLINNMEKYEFLKDKNNKEDINNNIKKIIERINFIEETPDKIKNYYDKSELYSKKTFLKIYGKEAKQIKNLFKKNNYLYLFKRYSKKGLIIGIKDDVIDEKIDFFYKELKKMGFCVSIISNYIKKI